MPYGPAVTQRHMFEYRVAEASSGTVRAETTKWRCLRHVKPPALPTSTHQQEESHETGGMNSAKMNMRCCLRLRAPRHTRVAQRMRRVRHGYAIRALLRPE